MPSDAPSDIELRASYYQEFLLERQKIEEYKWFESERQHRDIGWESALIGWVSDHRSAWKKSRSRKSES
jgi:hypothetical protein